jgi:hypothetical protein
MMPAMNTHRTPAATPAAANTDGRLALRPRDAARALSVSERWLWQATKDGLIPCIRLRGLTLYSVEALRTFLAEQAKQSGEPA